MEKSWACVYSPVSGTVDRIYDRPLLVFRDQCVELKGRPFVGPGDESMTGQSQRGMKIERGVFRRPSANMVGLSLSLS